MKLLIVTSLKEYQKAVAEVIDHAGIEVFSVTETIGFKNDQIPNMMDGWFSSGRELFDSIFLFSFTQNEKAEQALNLIEQFNEEHKTGFPVRAFIIPVEKTVNI